MIPSRWLALFFWLLLTNYISAAQTIQNLYFNSTSNIVRLNFSGNAPAVQYTGVASGASVGEGIAHAEDVDGNVVLWINASGVYDRNGALMPGSTGIMAHPSSTEIVVCPFPKNSKKFYLIYNNQLCSSLYYAIVDMNLRNGLGDVTGLNLPLDVNNNYAEGLEIVKIPCSGDYWLLAYQCYTGFKRFRISASGFDTGTLIEYFDANNHQGRGELDYHNGKVGYSVTYGNRAFIAYFDPMSGNLSNPTVLSLTATNGMYGLEFSPDASKVYLTDWNNHDFLGNIASPNLFQYDFATGTTQSWTIDYNTTQCSGREVEGLGQIELAQDGRLYIPHVNGCQITVIENPDQVNPVLSTLDVTTILSAGVSDPIQSSIYGTLVIEASKRLICPGESVQLSAMGGAGNYQWQRTEVATDSATIVVTPRQTTTYWLYADTEYGCRDSVSLIIQVDTAQAPIVEILPRRTACGTGEVYLRARPSTNRYRWYKDGEPIATLVSDSIRITELGWYSVADTGRTCAVLSEERLVDETLFTSNQAVLVPNVITPDNDPQQLNETFRIQHYSGRLRLMICNRWGKEIFRSEDYQNDWAAEGLPSGVYYYQLSHAENCFPPIRGWIQVLR